MNVWEFLGLWFLLGIVLTPLVGHCIHFGMNGPDEMEKAEKMDGDVQRKLP